ncbi:bifunctional DNA-formamidopyrimidine glycosylase/DNA-(apurinic or apyrimidinic site) lyase [Candidatus Saccharibacteria bacterium]|nr:bifunctional DNA-formamidopyrimidine glycosylase/DNA-(apurinic or apyrimidinic site) lyase [Candidatus Saccharibacteria bacterium]MBR3143803.1 bifunctional DNA-formamidopyrimidine glycosylase/DNA-(apurinic or apyrimidinic site) lyase [Candidatus Saccharibacteria bacterium]
MPELPEVETIKRGLSQFIIKKKLVKTTILCEKSFIGVPVVGTVKSIRRFGKALVIDLDNDKSLMIHLRMTGQLIYDGKERYAAGHPSENFTANLPNKQTRVILHFDSGPLYFNDQRKFGFIKVLPTSEVEQDAFIKKLAPEPWAMQAEEFYRRLQRHKSSLIKATILDQTIICGLGNIYADEALFAAGIHPERRSGTLNFKESSLLLKSACEVMDRSIASGGSTMATYVKADGTKGDYLEKFAQVFHRENQACPRCKTKIIKIRVAGRGTHICPHCQSLQAKDQDD